MCCISFDSYIKPQQFISPHGTKSVVYLLIPTSNHNVYLFAGLWEPVVYLLIPTSNHNGQGFLLWTYLLYIFWFLHQTTTSEVYCLFGAGCISFDSYIKPQPRLIVRQRECVVYLLIPTSNHNSLSLLMVRQMVVYLLIPTSNHNKNGQKQKTGLLYIFWFLHQTTTYNF